MASLEDIIQHGLKGKKPSDSKEQIDEVQKTAGHIKVIDDTVSTADKLAGGPAYREQLQKSREELAALTEENKKLIEQVHRADIATIKSELGGKIDQLTETVNRGAPREKITDQIDEIKKTATALGLGSTKMSELNEMMTFIEKLRPDKDLSSQIKDAQDLLKSIEPQKRDEGPELPASIALQMKKMDHDLQIQLQHMEDERQERQHKFELTMLEFKDNREFKKAEIEAKIAVERERNELLGSIISRFGAAAAKGSIDAGAIGAKVSGQVIEAGEGDFGEAACPSCGNIIAIAKDAAKTICPSCKTIYPIHRIPKEPGTVEVDV